MSNLPPTNLHQPVGVCNRPSCSSHHIKSSVIVGINNNNWKKSWPLHRFNNAKRLAPETPGILLTNPFSGKVSSKTDIKLLTNEVSPQEEFSTLSQDFEGVEFVYDDLSHNRDHLHSRPILNHEHLDVNHTTNQMYVNKNPASRVTSYGGDGVTFKTGGRLKRKATFEEEYPNVTRFAPNYRSYSAPASSYSPAEPMRRFPVILGSREDAFIPPVMVTQKSKSNRGRRYYPSGRGCQATTSTKHSRRKNSSREIGTQTDWTLPSKEDFVFIATSRIVYPSNGEADSIQEEEPLKSRPLLEHYDVLKENSIEIDGNKFMKKFSQITKPLGTEFFINGHNFDLGGDFELEERVASSMRSQTVHYENAATKSSHKTNVPYARIPEPVPQPPQVCPLPEIEPRPTVVKVTPEGFGSFEVILGSNETTTTSAHEFEESISSENNEEASSVQPEDQNEIVQEVLDQVIATVSRVLSNGSFSPTGCPASENEIQNQLSDSSSLISSSDLKSSQVNDIQETLQLGEIEIKDLKSEFVIPDSSLSPFFSRLSPVEVGKSLTPVQVKTQIKRDCDEEASSDHILTELESIFSGHISNTPDLSSFRDIKHLVEDHLFTPDNQDLN